MKSLASELGLSCQKVYSILFPGSHIKWHKRSVNYAGNFATQIVTSSQVACDRQAMGKKEY